MEKQQLCPRHLMGDTGSQMFQLAPHPDGPSDAWQEVEQKLGDRDGGETTDSQAPIQYTEKTPGAAMKNFVPIDLEEWWAQRFLANIANLS